MCNENKETLLGFYIGCCSKGIKAGKMHRCLDDLLKLTSNNKKKYTDYFLRWLNQITPIKRGFLF